MEHKKIDQILKGSTPRWHGRGFLKKEYFPLGQDYNFYQRFSPFLQLDYQEPYFYLGTPFEMNQPPVYQEGLGMLTIVLAGELSFRFPNGTIHHLYPGDGQYLSAGKGLIHKQSHPEAWAKKDRILSFVQLFINLPGDEKKANPQKQVIQAKDRPYLYYGEAGDLNLYAGTLGQATSPLTIHPDVTVFKANVLQEEPMTLTLPEGVSLGALVLAGEVSLHQETLQGSDFVLFSMEGTKLSLKSRTKEANLLFFMASPLNEPLIHIGHIAANSDTAFMAAQERAQNSIKTLGPL